MGLSRERAGSRFDGQPDDLWQAYVALLARIWACEKRDTLILLTDVEPVDTQIAVPVCSPLETSIGKLGLCGIVPFGRRLWSAIRFSHSLCGHFAARIPESNSVMGKAENEALMKGLRPYAGGPTAKTPIVLTPHIRILFDYQAIVENETAIENSIIALMRQVVKGCVSDTGKPFNQIICRLDAKRYLKIDDESVYVVFGIGAILGLWTLTPCAIKGKMSGRERLMWADPGLEPLLPWVQFAEDFQCDQ